MVRRLSEELAARDGAAGSPGAARRARDAAAPAAAASLPGSAGEPLPWWLKDSRYLNPLLTAYDGRIVSLEGQLSAKVAALNDLRSKVRCRTCFVGLS